MMENFINKKVSLYEEFLRSSEFWDSKEPLEAIVQRYIKKYFYFDDKKTYSMDAQSFLAHMAHATVSECLRIHTYKNKNIFFISKEFGATLRNSKSSLDKITSEFFLELIKRKDTPNYTNGKYCLEFGQGNGPKNAVFSTFKTDKGPLGFNIFTKNRIYPVTLNKPTLLESIKATNPGDLKDIHFIIKVILYIHGQNMDVNKVEVRQKKNNPKKNKQRRDLCESLFDYMVVGFGFHNKEYKTDEWGVATHMRFQPCGPGNTQVKLIWVKSHTRKRSEKLLEKVA